MSCCNFSRHRKHPSYFSELLSNGYPPNGGDRMFRDPVIEPKETLADNSKAYKVLGWKPTTKIEDWIVKYKEEMGL